MITRRCTQRQFLLRPSRYCIQVFLYCLAVAAQRTGVIVHAVTVMSNHYHAIVTDPLGRLPEFYRWLHEFVGKALNVALGRSENFWSSEPTSRVELVDPEAVLDKVVYVLSNPVAAGLVSHGKKWPGVRLYRPGRITIKRPKGFFREHGPTPDEVELELVAPPVGAASDAEAMRIIEDAVAAKEEELRAQFRAEGRTFLGRRRVLAQRTTDAPTSPEPRRSLSPTLACRNKWLRIEALQRCKQFVAEYREAMRQWCAGLRDVLFPFGTYWMVRHHNVAVADP